MLPHADQPIYATGTKLEEASAAMILIHGRGANAEDILSLSAPLSFTGLAYLAPQAENFTWYPNRFIFPVEKNEPYLSGALAKVDSIVKEVEARGIPSDKIFLGGFSQGACLASEYAIRNPKKYAGLFIFSGGYIGALNQEREVQGDLQHTPVFIGCSDIDPHIPLERVQETTQLLQAMNAEVTEKIYPGMGHTINDEEIALAREVMQRSL